jgi:hypothetical protein
MWRSTLRIAVYAILLFSNGIACAASQEHRCSADAMTQAKKLLEFHFGSDKRAEIDKSAKIMAPVRNPANKKELLDVLEVWGHIYKGQYRMRFIYARLPGKCILLGQEILEFADL